VTINPGSATAGGFATLGLQVPNERDDASTTKIEVQLPTDSPLASVSVEPHAGWSHKEDVTKLTTPVRTDDGEITDAVSRITWTADNPAAAIKPGEFAQFRISVGPLPDKAGTLAFKTLQTYSNGEVVRWIDVAPSGGPEPEHPAPTLSVLAASSTAPASSATGSGSGTAATAATATGAAAASKDSSDGTARGLAVAGIVVGALGLGAGAAGLAAARRRRGTAA
jgi:uncharacterized protein